MSHIEKALRERGAIYYGEGLERCSPAPGRMAEMRAPSGDAEPLPIPPLPRVAPHFPWNAPFRR